MAVETKQGTLGKGTPEERIKKLEERLEALLSGKTELEVVEVKELSVAPRSKLRVMCE